MIGNFFGIFVNLIIESFKRVNNDGSKVIK